MVQNQQVRALRALLCLAYLFAKLVVHNIVCACQQTLPLVDKFSPSVLTYQVLNIFTPALQFTSSSMRLDRSFWWSCILLATHWSATDCVKATFPLDVWPFFFFLTIWDSIPVLFVLLHFCIGGSALSAWLCPVSIFPLFTAPFCKINYCRPSRHIIHQVIG